MASVIRSKRGPVWTAGECLPAILHRILTRRPLGLNCADDPAHEVGMWSQTISKTELHPLIKCKSQNGSGRTSAAEVTSNYPQRLSSRESLPETFQRFAWDSLAKNCLPATNSRRLCLHSFVEIRLVETRSGLKSPGYLAASDLKGFQVGSLLTRISNNLQ